MRPSFAFALKAGVSFGVLALLIWKLGAASIADALRAADPVALALCTLASTVVYVPFARRWVLIADAIGLRIRFADSLRLVTIGAFFNQVLPSSIGGDVVRVLLLRRGGGALAKIVSSVLIDRLAALAGMLTVALVGLPLLPDGAVSPGVAPWIVLLAVGGAVAIAVVALLDRVPLPAAVRKSRAVGGVLAVSADLRRVLRQPARVAGAVGLGMIIHCVVAAGAWIVAARMGLAVGLLPLLVLMPVALLASMVPVSVAGWGVREGAMVVALAAAGVSPADAFAVSVVFGIAVTLAGLPGGALWMLGTYGPLPDRG